MQTKKTLTIQDLETPRFLSSSFYPYTLNDNGEVVLLMRNKKDSKNSPFYTDFGSSLKDSDYSIVYTAVKSYLTKTACLCVGSELENLSNYSEIEKRLREISSKYSSENDILLQNMKKMHEIMHTLFYQQSHSVIEIIGESHVAFFYPLAYFKPDMMNKVFAESEKFSDLSLQWIPLKLVADPDFNQKYITAFDLQVIAQCSEKLILNLIDEHQEEEFHYPEYATLICDERDHVKFTVEGLIGLLLSEGSKERWAHYKAYDLEFPSENELKHLKAIIFPGSKYSAYDNSIPWLEPLKTLIRKIYTDYPHIRLVGICFGHQLLAAALGGKVEKMTNLEGRPLFIGKETIKVESSFFKLPFVDELLKDATDECLSDLQPLYINEIHGDHVTELPPDAELHGTSERTQVEIWTLKDRIFAMQAHPELNSQLIEDLVINKLYDIGRLDDNLKNEALENIYDPSKPLNRHAMLKFIYNFIRRPYVQ
ncbi:UNKNOWN [Stylonychia lemnae]|uniref:Glutamine amidotransferase domain-containing protein n=1 Tax=Stylonychia lemnae TaxID=5949 RepID=A0A077ZPS4_STYLE|nr:UNKNOWN [Stylonychia lemnae]|eukprot:CDW71898.1 UNKNOWN [Stylonychia lemnae]